MANHYSLEHKYIYLYIHTIKILFMIFIKKQLKLGQISNISIFVAHFLLLQNAQVSHVKHD